MELQNSKSWIIKPKLQYEIAFDKDGSRTIEEEEILYSG